MIVLIGGTKGGTGKTTLAVNLAALWAGQGRRVLYVDTDKQQTGWKWITIRNEYTEQGGALGSLPEIMMGQATGKSVGTYIRQNVAHYDDLIVDAGGYDSEELRWAMTVAELMLCPLAPSSFDLWSLTKLEELAAAAAPNNTRLRPYLVLTRAEPNPRIGAKQDAMAYLTDETNYLGLFETVIHSRVAFQKSALLGAAVHELKLHARKHQDAKAIAELESLDGEIKRAYQELTSDETAQPLSATAR